MTVLILLAGLFLPLFPLSIGINYLLGKLNNIWLKAALLIVWPLPGLLLIAMTEGTLPGWVLGWAALTALLYAYRLLAERELNAWLGFLATSLWSLLWFLAALGEPASVIMLYAVGNTVPLVMLLVLAAALEQRFGVAYTHLYGGLAEVMPRFSAALTMVLVAAIATPVFPGFFFMLKILTGAMTLTLPVLAIIILLSWLLWSWAGIRVLQGLLVGQFSHAQTVADLSVGLSRGFGLILVLLVLAGLFITGSML